MGLQQFANSLHQIVTNPHIPTGRGLMRHLQWQVRKVFNLFPFEQHVSSSRIVAEHGACSVSALIFNQGLYDYNNMQFLRWLLKDGGAFFDIGANIGSYTLVASEQEKARVYSFEPHPETFRLLAANLTLNRRENVRAMDIALGSSEGTIQLTDNPGSPINHRVDGLSVKSIPVPCSRLDRYCREWGVVPQFVKLDVEGYEYDVLQGFGDYLKQVEVLLIEMNGLSEERGVDRREIHALLTASGLRGPWRCDFGRRTLYRDQGHCREDCLYLSCAYGRMLLADGWRTEGTT